MDEHSRTLPVAAVAQTIAEALQDGQTGRAFRELIQLNDDLADEPPEERLALSETSPRTVGDRRYDAFLAALVEYRLGLDNLPIPDWVNTPDRFCDPPWDVADIPELADYSRSTTPLAFARHGVIIAASALTSV